MLEWLKTILGDTYTEDIDKKVSDEIGKGFVARSDFNVLNETKKALETQIKDRDADIEELKKVDAKGLQAKIAEMQTQYDTETKTLNEKLQKQMLDSKIDLALLGAKAKNTKAVRALLDAEAIKLDGENVLGLTDQLAAIQKDNPFLFGEAQTQNPPPPVAGGVVTAIDLNTTDMDAYVAARQKS